MADQNQDPVEEAKVVPADVAKSLTEVASASEEQPPQKKGLLGKINPLALLSNLYTNYKLLTLVGGSVILLLICGIAAYLFLFRETPQEIKSEVEVVQYSTNYYPLPEIKLRMKRDDEKFGYLVIGLTLKLPATAKPEDYQKMEPDILDVIQVYLSSVTLESFSNTKTISFTSPVGLERIRLNIIRRLNAVISPLVIESVLFRKLITQ